MTLPIEIAQLPTLDTVQSTTRLLVQDGVTGTPYQQTTVGKVFLDLVDEIGTGTIVAGDVVTVQSRRGEVGIHVRRDDGTPRGVIFIPFAYYEAAANLVTNSALDPFGKIPEFKYCAVQVTKGGQVAQVMGYGTNDPKRQKLVTTS